MEDKGVVLSIFFKHAVLTAVIYLVLTALLQLSLLIAVHLKGAIGIRYSRFGMSILFGLTWFLSFNLAWRILRLDR